MIIEGLLVGLIVTLAAGNIWHPIGWAACYPLISGTLTGIALGDPMTGMQAGAIINLAYLGWITAGGTMPGNINMAGVWGTALTILGGADPSLAISFAIPIGLVGILVNELTMTVNVFWVHRCDKNAEEGNTKMLWWNGLVFPQLTFFVCYGIPAFLMVVFGQEFITGLIAAIPESLVNALGVAGGLMPAIGIAMLLNLLGKDKMLPFFFIGFFCSHLSGAERDGHRDLWRVHCRLHVLDPKGRRGKENRTGAGRTASGGGKPDSADQTGSRHPLAAGIFAGGQL